MIVSTLTRLLLTVSKENGTSVRGKPLMIAMLVVMFGFGPSAAQKRGQPPQPMPATSREEEAWWEAQRNIESAIQRLETYLRESPNGNKAATARQQLAALRSLTITASRPEWVKMYSLPLPYFPDWRVASVDAQLSLTELTIEIRCEREDGGDCRFVPFDRAPLILIDNNGQYYSMLQSGALPQNVRYNSEGQAVISSGRIMSVSVDFAPLSPAAVSGQVYYRDKNEALPARFSLATHSKRPK